MPTVRAGKFPGKINEGIPLFTGDTVGDIINRQGLTIDGHEVRLNGSPANLTDPVNDGDTVTLLQRIKGNREEVR